MNYGSPGPGIHSCYHAITVLDWWNCLDARVFNLAMGGVVFVGLCVIIPVVLLRP